MLNLYEKNAEEYSEQCTNVLVTTRILGKIECKVEGLNEQRSMISWKRKKVEEESLQFPI